MATEATNHVYPPGELIREELEERGWTQQELAQIMGTDAALVSEIVNAKRAITARTAGALASAFGTSAALWMNLETSYRLATAKPKSRGVTLRARLFEIAPVREMAKRGWIEDSKNADTLCANVLKFFGKSSLDDDFSFKHAARKSGSYRDTTPAQRAWLYRAQQMANVVPVKGTWKAARVGDLVHELRHLAQHAEAVRDVPAALGAFGVRLVVVHRLPQAKMCGASFWLDERCERQPVIALAFRYDRIDNFWHTLMHEVKHIEEGEPLSVDVEVLAEDADKPPAEQRADAFAVASLVPQHELDDFAMRAYPLYSHFKIMGFAARMRVHPGIVVGQLQHRGPEQRGLEWTHFRRLLVPVRKAVTSTAFSDGFGDVVPL